MSSDSPNLPPALALPKDFDNIVRLFPLPNVVLFPGVVQALHIFEPRYCELAADALSSDELITMALVNSRESDKDDPRPELFSTVCIGKVVSHTLLDDGRYNLLLVGSARAKVVNEIVSDKPYRKAEVELLQDSLSYAPDDIESLKKRLMDLFRILVDRRGVSNVDSLSRMFEGELPFGQICDMIGYACGADPFQQYQVLDELEVSRRAEILISILDSLVAGRSADQNSNNDFPHQFSDN